MDASPVVTQSGRGLRREHAPLLADRGASVLVNDYSMPAAAGVAPEVVARGGVADSNSDTVAEPKSVGAIVDPPVMIAMSTVIHGHFIPTSARGVAR
jgi:hypothetical protein